MVTEGRLPRTCFALISLWCLGGSLSRPIPINATCRRVARNLQWGWGAVLEAGNNIKRSWPRFWSVFLSKFRWSPKKKVFNQAEAQFFWSKSHWVLDRFSSPMPMKGGLFSFLVQKLTSKGLKTGYFAYSSGQWGVIAPPRPPGYATGYATGYVGPSSCSLDGKNHLYHQDGFV